MALLADTHISADPDQVYPGTNPIGWSAKSVVTLNPRPTHLIINGDCALSVGKVAEYKHFLNLVEPIRVAGITIHVTIGNHDNRKNLWKLLPFLKKEQIGIQADVIELPHANLVLLDSGKGTLGDQQAARQTSG